MDSLLVKKLADIYALKDLLLLHTNKLESAIEHIKSENIWLKLLPFFGVIIGGLITYIGQSFLKSREIKIGNTRDKREAVNKIFTNITGLNFYLRELAYLEVDSKYQYQLSCKEKGDNKKGH